MNRVTGHTAFRHAVVLVAFAAASVAMTWPLATSMSDHVLLAPYHWDAYTNTMLMGARVNAALGQLGIYENYFFAPITNTIAFNENLFGLSLLFAPFYLTTHNPLLAYNLVLLLSLTLSGYFTFLLVRSLSGSWLAGLLAGVAFAFCPYALFEIGRLQLVATQWIPLFFLFLQRAAQTKRVADVAGLGFAYTMQVGTCLYYAMFMLPLALLFGVLLALRYRPFPRTFLLKVAAVAVPSIAAVLAMVGPYFRTRKAFGLIRSERFAEDFDGKLSFLFNVHTHNKLLTFMHHVPDTSEGAHEEIAFPTFTIIALCLVAVIASAIAAYSSRQAGDRRKLLLLLPPYVAFATGAAVVATLAMHSFLAGAAVILLGVRGWHALAPGGVGERSQVSQWLWGLPLTLALFLGLAPLEYGGEVVRGLYYYLHAGVPGYDGIRKVSRQAVMLMLCFAVLGGFGAAILLRSIARSWARGAVFAVLLGALLLELRSAPMALAEVPAGPTAPSAYRFIAGLGKAEAGPIVITPSNFGKRRFVGPRGLALHNYLSLYHGRRTLNGKSSWIPPVTHMVHAALRKLPSETALRVLQILGARLLVVHGDDIDPRYAASLAAGLDDRDDLLRRVFHENGDSVYELLPSRDKSLGLLPTPVIDERLYARIRRKHIAIRTARNNRHAQKAIDDDLRSRWSTQTYQVPGDWVEFTLDRPRHIAAIDFQNYRDAFEAPASFKIQTSKDGHLYESVFRRPRLRFYADQVHRPTRFIFRVVLPSPVRTQILRIKLLQDVPGRPWSIHDAQLWTPLKSVAD